MKAKTILVAAVMFLAFTAAAYSQAFFTVGSTPVTAVIKTGYAEKTGDITFSTVPPNTTLLGTITVSYGVPITNLADPATGIHVKNISWVGAALPTINAVANGAGQVVINIAAGGSGVFTLTGVRIAIQGSGLTTGPVNAQLSASLNSNNFVAGQTSAVVITSIADGIASVKTTAGVLNYSSGHTDTQPVIAIKEGFLFAYGYTAVTDPTQTTGLMLRITLSSALPANFSLVFPATAQTDATTPATFSNVTALVNENSDGTTKSVTGIAGAAVTCDSTTATTKIYYLLTSDSDPTKQETLTINPTLAYGGATLPPPPVSISYTVTLAPIASASGVKSDGTLTANLLSPRYADNEITGGVLFGTAAGTGQSNMLIPFASYIAASNYNTGIAIANTTLDPGAKVLFPTTALNAAIPQPGTITFYMYPQGSASATQITPYTYTTQAGSPGLGLNSAGQVIPGSTYSVQLNQLLGAAGYPAGADFNGYVIAVASFANAHCQYIITDFKAFANGGQALIMNLDRLLVVEALDH